MSVKVIFSIAAFVCLWAAPTFSAITREINEALEQKAALRSTFKIANSLITLVCGAK